MTVLMLAAGLAAIAEQRDSLLARRGRTVDNKEAQLDPINVRLISVRLHKRTCAARTHAESPTVFLHADADRIRIRKSVEVSGESGAPDSVGRELSPSLDSSVMPCALHILWPRAQGISF